jgi:tetraacyldisaccharide 4'-kinase
MRAVRPWAWPLVPVYGAVLAVKDWAFRRGCLRVGRLESPVISVGSVSAGGAGKTPVVLALAELLAREGIAVRVLSRGYGRSGDAVERVDPEGDAGRFGDEPLLLARRMPEGGAVYVGANRFAAGRLAERESARSFGKTVASGATHAVMSPTERETQARLPAQTPAIARVGFVLDDGFQHRRLGRDLDVVLVTQRDVEDCLLPAGNLRDPLRAIRRADVVVVREDETAAVMGVVGRICSARMPEIWVIRRRLEVDSLPSRIVVFSGIARPEGFVSTLAGMGCLPVVEVRFRDHHRYGDEDVERLVAEARRVGADGFCTTEKDWVKLTPRLLAQLETVGPVQVAKLRVEWVDEAAVVDRLRGLWRA